MQSLAASISCKQGSDGRSKGTSGDQQVHSWEADLFHFTSGPFWGFDSPTVGSLHPPISHVWPNPTFQGPPSVILKTIALDSLFVLSVANLWWLSSVTELQRYRVFHLLLRIFFPLVSQTSFEDVFVEEGRRQGNHCFPCNNYKFYQCWNYQLVPSVPLSCFFLSFFPRKLFKNSYS